MKIWKYLIIAAGISGFTNGLQAQTITNQWTYNGGGLDPLTYSGNFTPSVYLPDTAFQNGGTMTIADLSSGGLGSGSLGAYKGLYTFFAGNPIFTITNSTILSGIDEFSFTMTAGGGDPTLVENEFNALTVILNYNGSHTDLVSSTFEMGTPYIDPSTPVGPMYMTPFTWTWKGLAALGATTGISISWDTSGNQHVFINQFSTVQAIPEPSTIFLFLVASAIVLFIVLRRKRNTTPQH